MAWKAPDGKMFNVVDTGVIAMYYDDQDYEDELDELNPEVEVLDAYYGEGYIRRRLSYGDFRAGYLDALYRYAAEPERIGFKEVSARGSGKPARNNAPKSNAPKGKAPAKKQPKKAAGKGRR